MKNKVNKPLHSFRWIVPPVLWISLALVRLSIFLLSIIILPLLYLTRLPVLFFRKSRGPVIFFVRVAG